jgi:hypothetical protein
VAKVVSGTFFDIVFNKYLDIVHSRGDLMDRVGLKSFENSHVDIALRTGSWLGEAKPEEIKEAASLVDNI